MIHQGEPAPVNKQDSQMTNIIPLDSGRQMSVSRSNELASPLGKKIQFFGITDNSNYECWVDQTNYTAVQRFNQDFKPDATSPTHAYISQARSIEQKKIGEETKDSIHLYEYAMNWALNNLGLKGVSDIETLVDSTSPEYLALLKKGFVVEENPKIKPEFLVEKFGQIRLVLMRYVFPKIEQSPPV